MPEGPQTSVTDDPPRARPKSGMIRAARARTDDEKRGDRLTTIAFRFFIWSLLRLPYRWRVPLAGFLVARVVAPLAGYAGRVRNNLALVLPDMPQSEVRRLMRAVPDNVGRTVAEIWSGREFIDRVRDLPLTGPGAPALEAAHRENRPVILATGHFGNYDVARAALIARGYRVGALYRPMVNRGFNKRYVAAISRIGTPLFPRGREGMGGMIKFLRDGGMLGLLTDQHVGKAEPLKFFGHTARTATSAADLALKYGAQVIPVYAVRQPDGLSFRIIVEEPIAPGTPAAMSQAINDSLEALVRRHPEQWFWIHRRWK